MESSHPPRIALATPPLSRYFLPFPTGMSQTSAAERTWVTSLVDRAQFRSCSYGEMTPLAPLQLSPSLWTLSAALAYILESVYETRRNEPRESRFSTLAWNEW